MKSKKLAVRSYADWDVDYDGDTACVSHVCVGMPGNVPSAIFVGVSETYPPDDTVMDANARLFIAARDLLEGCKLALMAFEKNANIDWSVLARAIKKAGKQP